MPKKATGFTGIESDFIRLLWNPYAFVEINRPDLPCGPSTCTLTACLSEEQLAVLRQIVILPLQLDYSPFTKSIVEEINLLLFGDQYTYTP